MKLSEIKSVEWRVGSRMSGDAMANYKELEKIRKRDGFIKPAAVVDAARDEANPMHVNFEWSDDIASSKFRDQQARFLTRSVVLTTKARPTRKIASFVCVSEKPADPLNQSSGKASKVYIGIQEALEDPITRDEILSIAIREALAYRKKYAELSELSKVFIAIDETLVNFNKELAI